MKEKPILFNTEMVKAILEGRKTSTRRIIKEPFEIHPNGCITRPKGNERLVPYEPPYSKGDILYVRETWAEWTGGYAYKVAGDYPQSYVDRWKPSIHMPKDAARIFLKITDVKVQRLQDITEDEAMAEGIRAYTKDGQLFKYAVNDDWWAEYCNKHKKSGTSWQQMPTTAKEAFKYLWDSCYDWPKCWSYNPCVWVIEFEKLDNYKI
jgi:hypothetical protein